MSEYVCFLVLEPVVDGTAQVNDLRGRVEALEAQLVASKRAENAYKGQTSHPHLGPGAFKKSVSGASSLSGTREVPGSMLVPAEDLGVLHQYRNLLWSSCKASMCVLLIAAVPLAPVALTPGAPAPSAPAVMLSVVIIVLSAFNAARFAALLRASRASTAPPRRHVNGTHEHARPEQGQGSMASAGARGAAQEPAGARRVAPGDANGALWLLLLSYLLLGALLANSSYYLLSIADSWQAHDGYNSPFTRFPPKL